MSTWSIYDPVSGFFTGAIVGCKESDLAANIPQGLAAIEGRFDDRSQRVENGLVVDWQPPKPDDDHEWDGRRWSLLATAATRLTRRQRAVDRIEQLERTQARSIREFTMDATNVQARARLTEIDQEIATLRADLIS